MSTKLIIVADLGLLRAYREDQGPRNRDSRITLIRELRPESAHQKISEQVTDQAGRFPRGSGSDNVPGDMSAGEQLQFRNEQRRRIIRLLAEQINSLLADTDVTDCSLAASAQIHRQLLQELDAGARAKIGLVVASNLAHTDSEELPRHLDRAAV